MRILRKFCKCLTFLILQCTVVFSLYFKATNFFYAECVPAAEREKYFYYGNQSITSLKNRCENWKSVMAYHNELFAGYNQFFFPDEYSDHNHCRQIFLNDYERVPFLNNASAHHYVQLSEAWQSGPWCYVKASSYFYLLSMVDEILPHICVWPESSRLKASFQKSEGCSPIYTMPGVKFTESVHDKVCEAYARLRNVNMERPSVTPDFAGLKMLVQCGQLKAALNLTTKLLTEVGQGPNMAGHPTKNSLLSFEVWSIRFQIFMALKMYSTLIDELAAFGELDAPDTYLQYYPEYASFHGSIIPYSLRLVHAEVLSHTNEPWAAFTRVQRLAENTKQALEMVRESTNVDVYITIWNRRLETIELLKARFFQKLKRYGSAFLIYENFLRSSLFSADEANRRELLALLVRMALSVGSSVRLNNYMEKFMQSSPPPEKQHVYECFKAIFYGNYALAEECLNQSNEKNLPLMRTNNEAISLLYNGKVEESLALLIRHEGGLTEPLAVNLTTISDLASTSNNQLRQNYFLNHCANVNDLFDPALIKIDS